MDQMPFNFPVPNQHFLTLGFQCWNFLDGTNCSPDESGKLKDVQNIWEEVSVSHWYLTLCLFKIICRSIIKNNSSSLLKLRQLSPDTFQFFGYEKMEMGVHQFSIVLASTSNTEQTNSSNQENKQ